MKNLSFEIEENRLIADEVYELVLKGDTGLIQAPGQFVNIEIKGFYLRRPISICSYTSDRLTLIYKVVGKGTRALSEYGKGMSLDMLIPLGNGFDVRSTTSGTVLVGGGVGVPPLIGLAKKMIAENKKPQAVIGFNSRKDAFGADKLRDLGMEPIIVTADGSLGRKGMVTDVLRDMDFDYICCCGPEPMLKALHGLEAQNEFDGQFSFEARMACGFGGCMGCSCGTITGYKRICKEGPVLYKNEIKW